MSVLHQRAKYEHLPRLVSQVHMMAGQNIKKKYLMCQIPIKMLRKHGTPNSSLHKIKIYSSKECKKLAKVFDKDEYVQLASYLANTAVLNVRIFSRRYHFGLQVFASTGEYIYYYICVLDLFHLQRVNRLYRKYKPLRITQKEHLLIWNSEATQKPKHLSS